MPRKPKPHALKVVAGTTRGKATEAAQARLSGTAPPAFLSDRAAQHWPDLADLLAGMNVLADGDLIALVLLCETLCEWIEAGQTIAQHGATYEAVTEAGATMHRAHPAVAQRADAARRVQSLLSEFGLTPAARAKVQGLPDLPGDDPAKAYFSCGALCWGRRCTTLRRAETWPISTRPTSTWFAPWPGSRPTQWPSDSTPRHM